MELSLGVRPVTSLGWDFPCKPSSVAMGYPHGELETRLGIAGRSGSISGSAADSLPCPQFWVGKNKRSEIQWFIPIIIIIF